MGLAGSRSMGFKRSSPAASSIRRWTLGLRLDFDDYTAPGEAVVDCLDVDFPVSGGIATRRPLTPFTYNLPSPIANAWTFERADGVALLMLTLLNGTIYSVTNGPGQPAANPVFTFPPPTVGRFPITWAVNGWLYASDGLNTWQWDGVNATTNVTASAYHPAVTTAITAADVTELGVPATTMAVTYLEAVFVADPHWPVGFHHNEVWWSAPIGPYSGLVTGQRDFYENQMLTFPTRHSGDRVIGLLPCGNRLLVLKQHSTHYIEPTGDALSFFAGGNLLPDAGISGPHAYACVGATALLYDERLGLILVGADGASGEVFDAIRPVVERNLNPAITAVGAFGKKIYLSIAEHNTVRNDRTYVYDSVAQTWTRHSYGCDLFLYYTPTKSKSHYLGATSSPCISMMILDEEGSDSLVDDFGCTTTPFVPTVSTASFDGGSSYVEKLWEKYDLQFEVGSVPAGVRVEALKDWSTYSVMGSETFTLTPDAIPGSGVQRFEIVDAGSQPVALGPVPLPGFVNRDSSIVEVEGLETCPSRAVSLRITSTGAGRWTLRQLFLLFRTKTVRR